MGRIHQGASVIATVFSKGWRPFLFFVLKTVLKAEHVPPKAPNGGESQANTEEIGFYLLTQEYSKH